MTNDRPPAEPLPRRRWPILILIAGLLVAGLPLWRKVPQDRDVHLDLEGPVESLELVWFAGDDAIRQSVMSFQRTAPPRRVTTRVSVPDGQYRLELRIDRGETVEDSVRNIDFTGGVTEVVIPVR